MYYTDKKGDKHSISKKELEYAVNLKIEYQKSNNGKCNWKSLCSKLRKNNIDAYPCENFRMKVRQYQKKIGKLPSEKKYSDFLSNEKLSTIREQLGEFNLQKREIQNYSREFGKLRRELDDKVLFRQQLLDVASKNIKIHPQDIKPIEVKHNNGALVVICTDWHIGACFDIEQNSYNLDIASQLIYEYTEKIAQEIMYRKPKKVFIYNLGDEIENVQMRKNQPFSIEFGFAKQVIESSSLQSTMIYSLATKFPDVKFEFGAIVGNHSRFSPNAKDVIPYDGTAPILRNNVKLATENLSNVEVVEPDTEYRTHIEFAGDNIALVHGDRDKMNSDDVLSKRSQADHMIYDVIVGGHLHHMLIKEMSGLICMAGSLIGPTDFSDSLSAMASRSQLILSIDDNGNIIPLPIKLGLNLVK